MFVLVFLCSFLFVSLAFAEVATLQKSVIWSADKTSDYKLPEISGGVYLAQDFIATDGQIKSLTANWQASGKISLEVSADSGLHYYPVTNGVPLKNNFVSGDRLRWRATALSADAKLSAVNINYTDTKGLLGNFGEPSLSGFLYRKEVVLKNYSGQDLYNYQLKLKIAEAQTVKDADINLEGHTLADFKDIRFSAADGQTPLPYYLESLEGATGSRTATVWVKVPQIPTTGVIFYLYYGNDAAAGLSDPNATFDFYEDFTATTLDKNKWVLHTEPKGSAELTSGAIKLDAAEIITKEFQFKEGIIEYSCSSESGFENSLNIRNKNEESYDSPIWLAYASIYKGAEHCIAVDGIVKVNDSLAKLTVAGEKYNYRITLDSGKIVFQRLGIASPAEGGLAMTEVQASAAYNIDPLPKAGYLSLRSGGDGSGKNIIYFGAIRARKAAATLPAIYNIGKEEGVTPPVFVDTKIASNGELVLKDDATSGYYLRNISTASLPVRIMIPSWKMDASDSAELEVRISADKGESYKKSCESEKFYYASKKDFDPGTGLKVRLDISRPRTVLATGGLSKFSLDYRPGKINIISPNGGETWAAGTEKEITWIASEYEASYPFNAAYSTDGGKNYTLIAENIPNSGSYLWNPVAEGKNMLIKIADANDANIFDLSDNTLNTQAAVEASDYLTTGTGKWSSAAAWVSKKTPGLSTEVTLSNNATIYADQPVSFRSLTIGDGSGKNTTTLMLKAGVNKGCQEIIVRKGGRLIQDGQEQTVIKGNLTVKSAGILTHTAGTKLDIAADSINIEPGSMVDASGIDNNSGGSIKLSAVGNFYIYSSITADGKEGSGASGGSISLSADKFGGSNAAIHAEGASAAEVGGDGGQINIIGKGGTITGTIYANGGKAKVNGKPGSIVLK
ncbi:MAG: DUF2341 domain-containing protein [Candidatus Omnitrophica bacterium]|nr:DUF2341 domain-containing protein [Candidatus Omnitrophota bacterium]